MPVSFLCGPAPDQRTEPCRRRAFWRCACTIKWAQSVADSYELSAMSQDEAFLVNVVALKAEGYSTDGNSVVVSLRTKFSSSEQKYSVPIECFRDFIVDLQRLNASKAGEPAELLLPLEEPTIAAAE
jgi:hypothetical protein